jgi:Uncharacterized protein conserved in bacteria
MERGKQGKGNMFQKRDFLLITTIILIIVISAQMILPVWRHAGEVIHITIDGKLYGEYNLSQNQTITINDTLGYNRVIIQSGSAYMDEADCPDKYCIAYKPIQNNGQTIICLPHKLVIEVMGEQHSGQVDVIVP